MHPRAERLEQEPGRPVTRVFDGNSITRRQQDTGHDVEGLLGATGNCDVVNGSRQASRDSDVADNCRAQLLMTRGMGVHASAHSL